MNYIALEGLAALVVQETPADVFSTPPQLDGELVTLTLLPRSRWQTLLNLEVIQVKFPPLVNFLVLTSLVIHV
jgi:U3 small nucleolar RNA-associated protein 21